MEEDQRRERDYVRGAAFEHAMGRGGVPELEVPLPEDDDALDCPDTATKAEWDALWTHEDLIRPVAILPEGDPLPVIPANDERLRWVKPGRVGKLTAAQLRDVMRERCAAERR